MFRFNLSNYELLLPEVDFFIEKIQLNTSFSFAKLNHAFWQMLNKDQPWLGIFEKIHKAETIEECVSMLKNLPNDENFMLGISSHGPPIVPNVKEGVKIGSEKSVISQLEKHIDINEKLYYGQMWKSFCIQKSFMNFMKCIGGKRVVLVGMKHLSDVGSFCGFRNFKHIVVELNTIEKYKNDILFDLKKEEEKSIIIFQCGEMMSFWFIYKLFGKDITMIDMGRSLDIFSNSEIDENTKNIIFDIEDQLWMKSVSSHAPLRKTFI
jgi:hypothetical protein